MDLTDVAQPWWRGRVNVTLLLCVAALTVIHAVNITGFPFNFEDEGTYVSQAWSAWVNGELSHYTYWYDHPPLGWLLISPWVFITRAFERYPSAVTAGRELLVVVKICNLFLLYALARRIGQSRAFSTVTIIVFGLSPLGIFWQRQVLLDNIAMPFLLAAFVLAYDQRRRLSRLVAGAVLLAVAMLIKETYLLFVVGYAIVVYQRTPREIRRFAIPVAACVAGLIVLLYPTFALLKGELLPGPDHVSLVDALRWQLIDREGTGSLLSADSFTRQTFNGWYFLDPFLIVVGTASTIVAIAFRRLRGLAVNGILLSVMPLRSGYTPAMYIIAFIPIWAISISFVLERFMHTLTGLQWADIDINARGAGMRWLKGIGAYLAVVLVLVVGVRTVPTWTKNYERLLSSTENYAYIETADWLEANYSGKQPILIDNSLWIDMILRLPEASGASVEDVREQTVWYFKLDSDPTVAEQFANGWEDFGWIVSTNILRASKHLVEQVETALDNSVVVKRFGRGDDRIEIRRVVTPARANNVSFLDQLYGPAVPRASVARRWPMGRPSTIDELPEITTLLGDTGLPPVDDGKLLRLQDGQVVLSDQRCRCAYRIADE